MRLWHEALIPHLPRAQLLGQHRECAALRGLGWGKPHATVNYVFLYSPYKLFQYHLLILKEMQRRGYRPDTHWYRPEYRGLKAEAYLHLDPFPIQTPIYPEHDQHYLAECLANLASKGIQLSLTL